MAVSLLALLAVQLAGTALGRWDKVVSELLLTG